VNAFQLVVITYEVLEERVMLILSPAEASLNRRFVCWMIRLAKLKNLILLPGPWMSFNADI